MCVCAFQDRLNGNKADYARGGGCFLPDTHFLFTKSLKALRQNPEAVKMVVRALWAQWVLSGGVWVNTGDYSAIVDDIARDYDKIRNSKLRTPGHVEVAEATEGVLTVANPSADPEPHPVWFAALPEQTRQSVLTLLSVDLIFDDTTWVAREQERQEVAHGISRQQWIGLRDYLRGKHKHANDAEDKVWSALGIECTTKAQRLTMPPCHVAAANGWILDMLLKASQGKVPSCSANFNTAHDADEQAKWEPTLMVLIYADLVFPPPFFQICTRAQIPHAVSMHTHPACSVFMCRSPRAAAHLNLRCWMGPTKP